MGQKSIFWGVPGSESCRKYMGASILMKIKIFKNSIFMSYLILHRNGPWGPKSFFFIVLEVLWATCFPWAP